MRCTNCSIELRKKDKFCPECGTAQAVQPPEPIQESDTQSDQPLETSLEPEQKDRSYWPFILIVAAIVVTIIIWASSSNNSVTSVEKDTSSSETVEEKPAPAPPPPWYPFGYEELSSNLAYQSLPVDQMNCGYSSAHSCYQIYLVSNSACTAFVDVNFLVNGVIVDSSLDSATLTSGGPAILSFVSFDASQYSGDKKVQITDASCY